MSSPQAEAPMDLNFLKTGISVLTESRVALGACLAILLWEWLTQLSLEYRHIWRAPVRHTTIPFLLLRYFTFVSFSIVLWLFFWTGTDETCRRMIYCIWLLPMLVHLLAQYLVVTRMYALYDRNILVLSGLGALTAAQAGIQAWLTSTLEVSNNFPRAVLSICLVIGYKDYWLFWGMPFIFDTVVLVLSLTKLAKMWRRDGRTQLVHLMIRDQIVWYAMTASLSAVNLAVNYGSQNAPGIKGKGTVSFILTAVTSMSICRVILNLRKSVSNDNGQSFSSLFVKNSANGSGTAGSSMRKEGNDLKTFVTPIDLGPPAFRRQRDDLDLDEVEKDVSLDMVRVLR